MFARFRRSFGCIAECIAAVILCNLAAAALPVHVEFKWPAASSASTSTPPHVHIQAIRTATSGSNNSAAPVEADAGPNGAILDLGSGVWQVAAFAPGYWSQETQVAIGQQNPSGVELTLWPAASLHGEIATAQGEPLPRVVEVRLSAITTSASRTTSPATTLKSELGPSHAELHCQINNGIWTCLGPAGLYDARLEASGYAPRYMWEMNLKAAENNDLGRTVLRQAASVFGRAVRKDASNLPGPCRAFLRPDMERHGPGESDADSAPTNESNFSVPLSKLGYFQVVGVLPGKHTLSVVCEGASGFRELIVQADGETRIDPPLQLEELTLDVSVIPKNDPAGQPWQLTLDETAPRYLRFANKAAASAAGIWSRHGLMTGSYRVTVNSSDGTTWSQRSFNLDARTGPLTLHLASVNVAGRVMLSSQPVRARLVFTNNAGGQSATLMSDDDGRFHGLLPVTPNIRETSTWTIEARVTHPPVNQQLLGVNVPIGGSATKWLDLQLPTIAVRGSVVSADGQPQRNADVIFENSGGVRTTTSTDDAGNFEQAELAPGKYTAIADSPEGVSDRTPFEVTDGIESDLKLVLNPALRATFYVNSSQGPVPNATVQVWMKPGVPCAFARTDQNGRIEVNLSPGTTEVGMTVGAPGYALKLTRLKISNEAETDDSPNSANTITLDDSGATLVLNFNPPGRKLDSSATLYLVHNGAIQDARTVAGWGTDQAGNNADGPAVVHAIDPGKYALCSVTDPAQVNALWSGTLPSSSCGTGTVDEGDTLTLAP